MQSPAAVGRTDPAAGYRRWRRTHEDDPPETDDRPTASNRSMQPSRASDVGRPAKNSLRPAILKRKRRWNWCRAVEFQAADAIVRQ